MTGLSSFEAQFTWPALLSALTWMQGCIPVVPNYKQNMLGETEFPSCSLQCSGQDRSTQRKRGFYGGWEAHTLLLEGSEVMDLLECLTKNSTTERCTASNQGDKRGSKVFFPGSFQPGIPAPWPSRGTSFFTQTQWEDEMIGQWSTTIEGVEGSSERQRGNEKHDTHNTTVIVLGERPLPVTDNGHGSCTGFVWCSFNNLCFGLRWTFMYISHAYSSSFLFNARPASRSFSYKFFIRTEITVTEATDEHCECSCHSSQFSIDGNANLSSAKPSCALPSQKLPGVVTLPGMPEESIIWVRSNLSFGCQEELHVT